jgi:hypothetical protein
VQNVRLGVEEEVVVVVVVVVGDSTFLPLAEGGFVSNNEKHSAAGPWVLFSNFNFPRFHFVHFLFSPPFVSPEKTGSVRNHLPSDLFFFSSSR